MTKIDTRQLRQQQKDWLDDIQERHGDNFLQMTDACNLLAEKYNAKLIGKDTLRQFYQNTPGRPDNRVLSDKTVFLLYKAYELEPSFATDLLYKMDEDDSDITQYAKFCKQFITELALAKGIYRVDLGRAVGISETTLSRLFNNKLPHGLQMKKLELLRERYQYNYSPSFRAFLAENKQAPDNVVPIVGYFSLKNGQVYYYAEEDRHVAPLPLEAEVKGLRAIEMKGPTIHPLAKDGMVAFYAPAKAGEVPSNCIDAACIATLKDGRVTLGLIERSHKRGLYRLHSMLDNSVEDVELDSASKLTLFTQA